MARIALDQNLLICHNIFTPTQRSAAIKGEQFGSLIKSTFGVESERKFVSPGKVVIHLVFVGLARLGLIRKVSIMAKLMWQHPEQRTYFVPQTSETEHSLWWNLERQPTASGRIKTFANFQLINFLALRLINLAKLARFAMRYNQGEFACGQTWETVVVFEAKQNWH